MKINNKIGVIVDGFRVNVRDGLKKAKEVGAEGVQIYAVSGEMDPANLSAGQRKDLKDYIDSLGLEVAALCGDLAGHGFQDKNENPEKIEKSKRILDLAVELGTNVVTTHIGIVPEDRNSEIYEAMQSACEELGVYAKSLDAYFAIETGPETSAQLKSFLDTLSTNGVSVNFDPANMIMVTGDDPVEGVYNLKDYIVHTHAKDGIQLSKTDPRDVYGMLGYKKLDHDEISEMGSAGPTFREVPLGEGKMDWPKYLKALQDIGYEGFLTIEREAGENPAEDIGKAVQFLKQFR